MKKQTLFSILTNNTRPLWQSIIFSFVLALGLAFGGAQTASAQQPSELSVEVGQIKSKSLKRQVYPNSINIAVNSPAIARARFDASTNQFRFEGLSTGATRITITGTYRELVVGSVIQENAIKFRFEVDVTVLPGFRPDDPGTIRIQVSRGRNRDYQIQYFLGQDFANPSEEGVKWRNVRLTDGDNRIATGELFDRNRMRLRVSGIATGKTTLTLQGERINRRVWQTISRTLEITVGTGADADAELRRRLGRLQDAAQTDLDGEKSGLNEDQLRNLIKQFENFTASVEMLIADERRRPNPGEERIRRLNSIIDDATKDLRRLREELAQTPKTVHRIGWYDRLADLNLELGKLPRRLNFNCPANPQKGYGSEIYGTDVYLINSTLCGAAVHAGVITFEAGGSFTAEFRAGNKEDKYLGSRRNGVVTQTWVRSWGSFVFVK